MDKKLFINAAISLIGILIYYLFRRVEINRKINKVFFMYLEGSMLIQKKIYKGIMLIVMAISIFFYSIIKFLEKKINTFVLGKNYEKYGAKHQSYMKISQISFFDINQKIMIRFLDKHKKEDKKSYNSVADILIDEKAKKNDNVMILLFLCVMSNYFLFFNEINIQDIIFLVLNVQIWLVLVNQILLNYRNKKGYYGTNYDEAKEIIYFIKKSSSDDMNKFGGKKILNEVEEQVSVTGVQKVIV